MNDSKKLILTTIVVNLIAGSVASFHHWYGAVVYDTMWRAGVSTWILAIVVITCSILYFYWKFIDSIIGKLALWLFLSVAVFFQTGFILFEAVYSHVLKNILYFGGVSQPTLQKLFPPPAYHLPDNLFFEFTGVLQLIGLLAAWLSFRVFHERPWRKCNTQT